MDENKILNLLERIYVELQSHNKGIDGVEDKLNRIEGELKKINVKIDEELIPTSRTLLDSYKDNSEHMKIIDGKIDILQIDVNSISMKVSHNNSRVIEISNNLKNKHKY